MQCWQYYNKTTNDNIIIITRYQDNVWLLQGRYSFIIPIFHPVIAFMLFYSSHEGENRVDTHSEYLDYKS